MSKILVWLSGGVDSAVAALLLKEAGHEVHAGFMINYLTDDDSCPTRIDMKVAKEVAEYLNIPFFTFDYREEYEKRIIESIYAGYRKGITPNPDILCNNLIKFDLFLEEARAFGYDAIATGHYARIIKKGDGFHLLQWLDPQKDQSYFLARLSQEQLAFSLFPIGHLKKSEVRSLASYAWLPNADRKDSQWLCFVGKVNMKEFLTREIPKKKGNILNTSGDIIGEHEGAYFYTIGQRKGIEIGGGPALFVIEKNTEKNEIIVGTENDILLYKDELSASDFHLIAPNITFPFSWWAKIRYRQEKEEVLVTDRWNRKIHAHFNHPLRAITSGQTIALYQNEELIGSAIID